MHNSVNLLVDFGLQRSSSFVEFRISLALTQVFSFLFEVIFRVDMSSNATIRLSNFIFLFLLIEEIR